MKVLCFKTGKQNGEMAQSRACFASLRVCVPIPRLTFLEGRILWIHEVHWLANIADMGSAKLMKDL